MREATEFLGKPLFLFCVEEFYKLPYIKKICIVSDMVEYVENVLEEYSLKQDKMLVVEGGQSRHMSIKNGLIALTKTGSFFKVVVIHDGARPIVPESLLTKVISGAASNGAATATRPLTSTVIKPFVDGCLESCLDRSAHLASETPQAFQMAVLFTAYQKLALKYCGIRAKVIAGPDLLWKVTDKKDYYSVKAYLREMATNVCLMGREQTEVMRALHDKLRAKVSKVEFLVRKPDFAKLSQTFNTVVCFHHKEIDTESQMAEFGTALDVERQGLIIHVVEHPSSDGMQSTSVYELHRSGRTMTKHYEKLKKGVVMIHCLSPGEEKKLINLIVTLVLTDEHTFSGQTLFL